MESEVGEDGKERGSMVEWAVIEKGWGWTLGDCGVPSRAVWR